MAGLFDYQDPDSVGRMMFAAGLLNAAGPSKMPVSTGQALAQGLMARQQGATEAGQNARRNELIAAQVQQQQMMMRELQRQQAEQEQARELMRQSYQTPGQQAVSQFGGPTKAAAQAMPQMPGGFNAAFMKDAAFKAGNPYAVTLAESYQKPRNLQTVKAGERVYDMTDPSKPKELIGGIGNEWALAPQQPFPGQQLYINKTTGEPKVVGTRPLIGSISVGGSNENKFVTKLEELQAQQFHEAQTGAAEAQQGNNALARIKGIVSQGGVTGGPTANIVVTARNLASQLGMPIDKVLDKNNAAYSAETAARIAEKIIKGGRSLTDSDVARIREAFPGYGSGIPTSQLPAFIAQLETINNERISTFREMRKNVNPALISKMPMTFTDVPAATATAAQPNPPSTSPAGTKSVDQIMREMFPQLTPGR
jgi:hypothetical protein